jgi:hypothetical protein
VAGWLSKLAAARARFNMVAPTDPGTANARVDLMFRERAFSLFGTSHRVGDLRRLSRHSNVRIDWCEIDEHLRTALVELVDATLAGPEADRGALP